ncbi:MAG: hypothetical protein ACTSV3_06015 [Candidatus Thorarchaeota archaeon]|nr:MAG: hypothetical protein DRP09_06245 [Candidatus Thorarchaeota archaeon]RLI59958.1 MAG: hypothetical protein DRO87_01245 [Candidatus Thorarchaeota archaeon]
MVSSDLENLIRQEIAAVAARKTILDQLEGGLKTGAELRDAIAKTEKAAMVAKGVSKRKIADYEVTSPKLYHNTRRLEELGIIVSWKQSQYRLFELEPKAIHAVRRALNIERPIMYVTSMSKPEDQRPLIQWISTNPHYKPTKLLVFVEARHWTRGVSRIMDRFIPEDAFRRWTTEWREIPEDVMGGEGEMEYGELQGTCDFIENALLPYVPQHEIVVDLTLAPTLIALALMRIAHEYTLEVFHVNRYDAENADITYL